VRVDGAVAARDIDQLVDPLGRSGHLRERPVACGGNELAGVLARPRRIARAPLALSYVTSGAYTDRR
jgi:hypothetical protein